VGVLLGLEEGERGLCCLEVRGVVEFGERIEETVERWRWRVREAEVEARDEGFGEGYGEDEREEYKQRIFN